MRFMASLRTVLWHSALALSIDQLDASTQVTHTQTQLAVGPKQASHTQNQLAVGHRQASHTQTQLAVDRGPTRRSNPVCLKPRSRSAASPDAAVAALLPAVGAVTGR